jgi:acetyl esterase
LFVLLHGGGFITGDIETEDPSGPSLPNATGCLVASFDYRLAPEHPLPAPLRDVYVVIEWLSERADEVGGDPERLLVGGASAGGNLAAASSHLVRDRDGPELTYQVLAYPAVSYEGDFESRERYDGYFVTREFSEWVNEQYLSDPLDGHNPYAYPLQADDFTGLPPATVVTAGFDMMLDESNAYANALREADVKVSIHHYEDMIHSFITRLQDPEWERAREAVSAVGDDVRDHLME